MKESGSVIAEMVGVIVRALVDSPDAVTVTVAMVGSESVCMVRVAPPDLGKIIGKSGRTARAIRILAGAYCMKTGQRVAIDLGAHPTEAS